MRAPKTTKAGVAGLALTAVLGLSLAACGSSSSGSSDSSTPAPSASSASPAAVVPSVSGVSTAVKLDSGFTDALTALKLTPGTVGTAQLTDGSLVFPITSGNVTYYAPGTQPAGQPYVQGILHHEGSGLSLTAGSTKVELTNFTVNPGTSMLLGDVSANGMTVLTQTPLFFLDGRTLQPLTTSGTNAILTGTKVEILPAAAALLNKTFGTTAVPDYFLVGVATITVATK